AQRPPDPLPEPSRYLLVLPYLSRGAEPERGAPLLIGPHRADVRSHDNDRVSEIDGATVSVGEPTILEDLQQCIEHLGVCLLDLVEQDHLVRATPHRLGELPALIEADIARRLAEQTADRVWLHVLGRVQPQK